MWFKSLMNRSNLNTLGRPELDHFAQNDKCSTILPPQEPEHFSAQATSTTFTLAWSHSHKAATQLWPHQLHTPSPARPSPGFALLPASPFHFSYPERVWKALSIFKLFNSYPSCFQIEGKASNVPLRPIQRLWKKLSFKWEIQWHLYSFTNSNLTKIRTIIRNTWWWPLFMRKRCPTIEFSITNADWGKSHWLLE